MAQPGFVRQYWTENDVSIFRGERQDNQIYEVEDPTVFLWDMSIKSPRQSEWAMAFTKMDIPAFGACSYLRGSIKMCSGSCMALHGGDDSAWKRLLHLLLHHGPCVIVTYSLVALLGFDS